MSQQSRPPRLEITPDGKLVEKQKQSWPITRKLGRYSRLWIWKWFHVSFRLSSPSAGPVGLGLRAFYWRPTPIEWSAAIDILTPMFDLQFGLHNPRPDAE